ncbi:YciI family protein [Ketogulonicigenium vulgare]|uniref:YciI-like protein n=1 Tax=Ketogulonicigenium vulgare (strain WSH-001) TaxID=759362 RepID=F9Y5U8_KETVW|nr:YciI family protein [Ketogulonicigenium vulgare]ADO43758.1 YciI-like protein [Ketogulonicigenium vulgare Y25]AEM42023.1 YciI-like protein [Ketogulonicigenium vulgare WSH-001]ALJ82118.1 hypothetical protein KVH_13670 [Ketogulonicigenium vulgare]ANW35215.1 hypothetical protein KvSKV_13580 [Ketogulonicigenium vulgare]AOZ55791.1 YciI-like protein [Ketogulonicigenium vulgare]
MHFAIICRDKTGALETRLANRDAHVAFLGTTKVAFAGPFLDEAGQMVGSLIVIEADSLQAAKDWAAGDPYGKAGLFEQVTIQEWKKVIG